MDEYEEAVLFTYALLESRLDRIEYILGGAKKQTQERPRTFPERIQRIEKALQEFSKKTVLLNDVQQLLSQHSDLLTPAPDAEDDAGLDLAEKSVMVVDRAPGFATTASQLKALGDQQIPQSDGFVKLAKLRPRIAEAENRHLQQALQISLLRKRSGMLVSRTKQIHLVGQGRCWVEWQKRLMDADRTIVRTEFRLKQDKSEDDDDEEDDDDDDDDDEGEEEQSDDDDDEDEDDEEDD
ncbi:hypothetical protein K504DRAFT_538588 [Pleomassaria siparia CBS 279.74]|uniref:Uncharacterized protein n=1 Tax=Pleomassaria siparia CBS 279.74 TaxID=1314801 RepID=A0A6G1JTF4_9PLEO|nr:hypothetical protein K504DRAFT_538588 [Pleomassaria siparia CBS 279.74]